MNKKLPFIVIGVICAAAAVFGGVKIFQSTYAPRNVATEELAPSPTLLPAVLDESDAGDGDDRRDGDAPDALTDAARAEGSPVDFSALQAVNPDIYAWLEIPGADISYPVVQSADDDTFYLDHNSDKDYSANGAIFSEHQYNKTDWSDPVTILYGHHMKSGAMFGNLQQQFSDADFFRSHQTFKIYTPDKTLTYGIFAAIPHDGDHILYQKDYKDASQYGGLIFDLTHTRDLSAQYNDEYTPTTEDQIVILSTCLIGNNTRRFLVMGKLLEEPAA